MQLQAVGQLEECNVTSGEICFGLKVIHYLWSYIGKWMERPPPLAGLIVIVRYMLPCILVPNIVPHLVALAFLQSSCPCPLYLQLWFSFCSSSSSWIRLTALIFSSRPNLGQHSKSSTNFIEFISPVQLQNTDGSASISKATSPNGSFTHAMLAKKAISFLVKVFPLFHCSIFHILQRPTNNSLSHSSKIQELIQTTKPQAWPLLLQKKHRTSNYGCQVKF